MPQFGPLSEKVQTLFAKVRKTVPSSIIMTMKTRVTSSADSKVQNTTKRESSHFLGDLGWYRLVQVKLVVLRLPSIPIFA